MANKKVLLIVCILLLFDDVKAGMLREDDPYPLFFLQKTLSQILVNDNFSPPVASRNYVYPHIAANYVLTSNEPGKKVYDFIGHFRPINMAALPKNYSRSLAASFAFFEVAKNLIYTRQPFIDSFNVLVNWYRKNGVDAGVFQNSQKTGEAVALEMIAWMNKDLFAETRRMNKYVLLKSPGKWQITSPGYFAAVEPHWGAIRPMLLNNRDSLDALLPVAFDTTVKSLFYKEAMNVYTVSKSMTAEQKLVASFWDCNPFSVHPTGHINTIVKKISPGGHWMSITAIACNKKQYNLQKTSEAFTLCAIALFDAFIYTWDKKYQYNYLRPETYIEQMDIDANWQPYIQSPPFPEFPSGHAVVSNTAAGILSSIFGKDFAFTDDTELQFGLPKRNFSSFAEAADEATISRVYGGIHFLFSCKIGQQMGKSIANNLLRQIH